MRIFLKSFLWYGAYKVIVTKDSSPFSFAFFVLGCCPPKIIFCGIFKQPPTTSHQEACRFVAVDLTAQLCLRIVLWLEGLASEALDLEKKARIPCFFVVAKMTLISSILCSISWHSVVTYD